MGYNFTSCTLKWFFSISIGPAYAGPQLGDIQRCPSITFQTASKMPYISWLTANQGLCSTVCEPLQRLERQGFLPKKGRNLNCLLIEVSAVLAGSSARNVHSLQNITGSGLQNSGYGGFSKQQIATATHSSPETPRF